MKKVITLLTIALLLGACKKTETVTKNTNTNTTTTKHCFQTKSTSYDAAGKLLYSGVYYYNGKKTDSIVGKSYNSGVLQGTSKSVYTWNSDFEATVTNFYNGTQGAGYSKYYYDADYNLIKNETYNGNNSLTNYALLEYDCSK